MLGRILALKSGYAWELTKNFSQNVIREIIDTALLMLMMVLTVTVTFLISSGDEYGHRWSAFLWGTYDSDLLHLVEVTPLMVPEAWKTAENSKYISNNTFDQHVHHIQIDI